MFLALFVKNHIFPYLTLKITMNHKHDKNNIKSRFFSQNYTEKRYYNCSNFHSPKRDQDHNTGVYLPD